MSKLRSSTETRVGGRKEVRSTGGRDQTRWTKGALENDLTLQEPKGDLERPSDFGGSAVDQPEAGPEAGLGL